MPKIHLTTPEGTTHDFEITAQRARIGRAADNDLVVPDGSVSSYHGEITVTGDGIHFQDRGSTNGTHVGGQRVEQADIPWGGGFRIGSCECVLEADAPVEAAGHEEPEAHEESPSSASSAADEAPFDPGPGAVITGLGATPCPSAMRRGFGPKVKAKDSSGSMIMLLAVVALLACAAAGFMIMKLGA